MKVETPQILWNSEEESNQAFNAPLLSVSLLQSGLGEDNVVGQFGNVLATAGNTSAINLWKLTFLKDEDRRHAASASPGIMLKHSPHSSTSSATSTNKHSKIEYLCSLTRHEGPVNSVVFSPDGLHLATAGETGTVIVWSVPPSKRGNGNGRHYWSTIGREQDLQVKIVARNGEGICDLSWSADSKRILAGTIDHSIFVLEDSTHHSAESDWKQVHRNGMDHTHFVQGVSYDPLGVYLASMSSDRSVRVYPRKTPPKSKKKVLRPANATGSIPPAEHQTMVDSLLTDSKLDMAKSKQVKFRKIATDDVGTIAKQHYFADESTLESFVRRLSWTVDGAFLVTPAALWHKAGKDGSLPPPPPTYATLLFARHRFDEPCRVLPGLENPSVAVRPNPVLFALPPSSCEESKENKSPARPSCQSTAGGLPYRSIFAVLTWDTVLIYDTVHTEPLSVVKGLHYANLVDASWSNDGQTLVVCSTDGYISILSWAPGEWGEVYTLPVVSPQASTTTTTTTTTTSNTAPIVSPQSAVLPPCEPGPTSVQAPPAKRAKIQALCVVPATAAQSQVSAKRPSDQEDVGEAVDKLSISEIPPKKKKKRIQPMLVSASTATTQ